MDKDTEESSGIIARVRLELRSDIDGERGGEGGEQTILQPSWHDHTHVSCKTHQDESCARVLNMFLHKFAVVLLSLLAVFLGGHWTELPDPWEIRRGIIFSNDK